MIHPIGSSSLRFGSITPAFDCISRSDYAHPQSWTSLFGLLWYRPARDISWRTGMLLSSDSSRRPLLRHDDTSPGVDAVSPGDRKPNSKSYRYSLVCEIYIPLATVSTLTFNL